MPSLRETIEKNFDAASETPAPEVEQIRSPQEESTKPIAAPVSNATPYDARATTESHAAKPKEKVRDESGRFVSKEKVEPKVETAQGEGGPSAGPADGAAPPDPTPSAESVSELKPPANWKPVAKEKWASLPREVQEEAIRVHVEASKALHESAEARKSYAEVKDAYSRYEPVFRSAGVSVSQGLENMGQIMWTVHQGSSPQLGTMIAQMASMRQNPDHAAQAIAHAINTTGLDIELVNRYLGNPSQAPAQPAMPDVNALVNQALEERIRLAQQAKEKQEEESFSAQNDLYQYCAPLVKAIMRENPGMTRQQAYEMAAPIHNDTKAVWAQREEAKKAQAATLSTQRSKLAASSIKPSPAVSVSNGTKQRTLRESLEAAWDTHAGRT